MPNFSEQVTIQYSYVFTYSAGESAPTSMPPITKNVISKSTMIKITAYRPPGFSMEVPNLVPRPAFHHHPAGLGTKLQSTFAKTISPG